MTASAKTGHELPFVLPARNDRSMRKSGLLSGVRGAWTLVAALTGEVHLLKQAGTTE